MKNPEHVFRWLVLFASAAPTQAAIIYDNFGTGNSYDRAVALGFDATDRGKAMYFRVPSVSDYSLVSIDVGLAHFFDGPNEIQIGVVEDIGGIPGWFPGTPINSAVIELFHLVDVLPELTWHDPPVTISSVSTPILESGRTYWLTAYIAADTHAAWYRDATPGFAAYADWGSLGWERLPNRNIPGVFRIVAEPLSEIPEPSTFIPFSISLGLAVRFRITQSRRLWLESNRRDSISGNERTTKSD